MPSPAFNNTIISNAYRGSDQVSKLMLGHNHVWPLSPEFSFDTYQSGGELNFRVVSDTQYVACMINDSDVFIYKTNGTSTDNIRAINLNAQSYNKLYQLSQTSNVIDISLPLYQRKIVKISGRGTRVTRYNADYNSGNILVEIYNPFGSDIGYNISLTGKGSITKTCVVGTKTAFNFTAVSRGTRTVTIQNLTDGTVDSTTVYINTNYTPVTIQNLTIGINKGAESTNSNTLTDIKVYSLTESEALLNIHGTAPVISVKQFYRGEESGYRGTNYYFALEFDLISGGTGLPASSQIQMRWVDNIPLYNAGTRTYSSYPVPIHVLTLVTDSVGRVVKLGPGTYWRNDGSSLNPYLPSGRVVSTSIWVPEKLGSQQSWTLNNPAKVTMLITRRTHTRNGTNNYMATADFRDNWISGGIQFIGTDSPISLVNHIDYGLFNLNTGAWVENLLFDNQDLVGNLQSVDLKDINVNSITSTTQNELQIIRSININTSTNKASNSNVKVINTNEFKSTHGSETTYQYYNGTWPYGFNPLIYRQVYPNTLGVAYSSSDLEGLWYHYKTWGAEQGFTHSADFLAQDYLDLNPDLQVAFGSDPSPRTSAMLHWFEYGIAEGRQGRK